MSEDEFEVLGNQPVMKVIRGNDSDGFKANYSPVEKLKLIPDFFHGLVEFVFVSPRSQMNAKGRD